MIFTLQAHQFGPVKVKVKVLLRAVSVKVGLLHYPQELLLAHLAVSVPVGLVDHLLEGDKSQVSADKSPRMFLEGTEQS